MIVASPTPTPSGTVATSSFRIVPVPVPRPIAYPSDGDDSRTRSVSLASRVLSAWTVIEMSLSTGVRPVVDKGVNVTVPDFVRKSTPLADVGAPCAVMLCKE